MKIEKKITLGLLTLFSISCSSGSESDISTTPNPDPTPTSITYTNTIKSIITTNCISCHGNPPTQNAPISLDTYAKVKAAVQNNGLIDLISLPQDNSNLMPKNGSRLPQSTIDKFTTWKNNGYVE
jgi:hypothetical protein